MSSITTNRSDEPRSWGVRGFLTDTIAMTVRNLRLIVRTPQLGIFAAIQPVMFVLLFRYVFGGSIHPTGYTHYIDYLLPGIIVQTTLAHPLQNTKPP